MDVEDKILFEAGSYWVSNDRGVYHVWKNGSVYATAVAAYPDFSLAILDCAVRAKVKMSAKQSVSLARASKKQRKNHY